eukprot:TRINITY_DN5215_c0_g2_i1.p1 TRINITY_DN5215_c0_g2~~TRINITY_DN5215_c0_g2_i1.p1  ORF type:complete len:450 (+),score=51.65 TRINITY_DN5215_c0_g2_i1:44-1393(+)
MMPPNAGFVEGCQASSDAKTADAPPNPIRVDDSNDVSVPQLAKEATRASTADGCDGTSAELAKETLSPADVDERHDASAGALNGNASIAKTVGSARRAPSSLMVGAVSILTTATQETGKVGLQTVDSMTGDALPILRIMSDFSGDNRVWTRRSGGAVVIFTVMAISLQNMYNIVKPKEYPTITRDEQFSKEEGKLPRMGFFIKNTTPVSFEVRNCTYGIEKVCQRQKTNPCILALGLPGNRKEDQIRRHSHCLPPDMKVVGIFGDRKYQYVEISFFMKPHASKPGTSEDVHLLIEEKPEIDRSFFYDYPFSFLNSGYWTCIEMFFKTMIICRGQVDGIFGRMITGFKQYLPSQEFLKYTSHVRRKDLTKTPTNTSRLLVPDSEHVFSIIFRSDLLVTREFYEQTSFMKLFEQSGGLWTSLGIICSVILITMSSLLKKLRSAWTCCLTRC